MVLIWNDHKVLSGHFLIEYLITIQVILIINKDIEICEECSE